MQRTYQQSLTAAAAAPFSYARPSQATPVSGRVPYLLLLLFILLFYANPTVFVPAVEAFRPTQLVAALAVTVLIFERSLGGRGLTMVWPESHLFLAFLAVAGLSCLTAFWLQQAINSISDLGKMAVVYFLIVNCIDSWQRLRGVIWVMVLSGLVPALGAISRYAQGLLVEGDRAAWIGVFGNPNDLAFSLVLLVPLAIFLIAESGLLGKAVLCTVIVAYAGGIYVSFSRGGVLGLLVVLAVLGLRHPAWSARLLTVALLIASCIGIANYWERSAGFGNLSTDFTVQQRVETIRAGFAMFLDHPVLGVGLGCSIVAFPMYANAGLLTKGALVNHNTFVQALGETGAPGFLLFIALLGASFYHARKITRSARLSGDRDAARLGASLEAGWWGFIACGLSGGYVVSWFPYLLLALIAAGTRICSLDPL